MSPEAYEVLAASAVPEERRRYFAELAEQADLLRCFLQLEDQADEAARRAAGAAWSSAFGARDLGPLFEVFLHSRRPEFRERAALAIVRALRRPRVAA